MSIFNNHSAEILILLFFMITYFMSVLEKLGDWKGTVTYYKNHFKGTLLQKMIPFLLIKIVVIEITVLILITIGLYYLVSKDTPVLAKVGLELSAITLLTFLFGQRLAKDYPGAMNIAVYFILNIIGIYLLT
jgi:putative oxidoreductase